MDSAQTAYILKRLIFKTDRSPAYFIYFVTGACPLECRHCFYHAREFSRSELGLGEIERFSSGMGRISFLLLTGGEPFSRSDFEEIPSIFYRNTMSRNFAVPTNGFFTSDVIEKTEKILNSCPEATLTVNVSLDGLGDLHDNIRQKKGAFDAACNTCKELVAMKHSYKNLDVGVCTVVSSLNQASLKDIYRFVKKELGIDIWAPFLTRGKPRDPLSGDVDMEMYKGMSDFMKTEISKHKYLGYTRFSLGQWNTAKNTLRRDIIYKIKKDKRMIAACYAGRLIGVMYPDGRVKPCELKDDTFGNIRDFDYNFKSLWLSNEAQKIRRDIDSCGCYCTHECFLTMNIMYNPMFWPSLARERLRLRGI
ncbi:MAG: radical SAM protein [Candidatus Omnitrophica bacterium]|nr:radical SAM protein [Candidatus Omnitrophota bacterium]